MGKITRAEWKWVWLFALGLMLLLLVPFLAAYRSQGSDWVFSGSLFGITDGNSYIAKMREGAEGAWLYRLAYTTEPQSGAFVFLPYLLLGKLAAGPALHLQLTVLFNIATFVAVVLLMLATYRFLACFVESVAIRRLALILAAVGGGFGWLLVIFGITPLEFYSPESFGFLSLLGLPHLAVARALLLLALVAFLDSAFLPVPERWRGPAIGGLLVLAWLFQPLDLPLGWAVMGATVAIIFLRERGWRKENSGRTWKVQAVRALTAGLVSAPAFLYSALAFSLDPVLRQWTAQNIIDSPPPWMYLAAYGVVLIPAILGAVFARKDSRLTLPIVWVVLLPVLVYLPINLQRRLADGAWVALVVLAAVFFERALAGRRRVFAMTLICVLALPSSALFTWEMVYQATNPASPVFLPNEEIAAFNWLDTNANPGDIVLTDFDAGNALPAYTGLIPFIGHGPETLYLPEKLELANNVFDGTIPGARRLSSLLETGAKYVLTGPEDAAQLQGLRIPECTPVYLRGGWAICEVNGRR